LLLQTNWPDKGIETKFEKINLEDYFYYKPIDLIKGLRLNLIVLHLKISLFYYKPIDLIKGLRP